MNINSARDAMSHMYPRAARVFRTAKHFFYRKFNIIECFRQETPTGWRSFEI